MALSLAPYGWHQFFSNAGAPLNGGTLTTRISGTTTPLATYTDSAGAVAHANPIVLNSAGRPPSPIYLLPAAYRWILADSGGSTLWDLDPIAATANFNVDTDVAGVAGEALSAGKAVYVSDGSGSLVAGRWYQTDADNAYSSVLAPMVGIVMSVAVATGEPVSVRISGRIENVAGLVAGTTYWLSAVAGAITATRPATGARIMGRADVTGAMVLDPNPQPLQQVLTRDVTTTTQAVIGPTTHFTYSVEGGTLGTLGALRLTIVADFLNNTGVDRTFTIDVSYGGTTIFSAAQVNTANAARRAIRVDVILGANGATNAQIASGQVTVGGVNSASGVAVVTAQDLTAVNNTIAEDSTTAKTLLMQVTLSATDANLVFRTFTATLEVM